MSSPIYDLPSFSNRQSCHNCHKQVFDEARFCQYCGTEKFSNAAGNSQPPAYNEPVNNIPEQLRPKIKSDRITAGILGILLGCFGVHKFMLGMKKEGFILCLSTILSCGILMYITSIIGLIEGVIYLAKNDNDFYQTYIVDKKKWF